MESTRWIVLEHDPETPAVSEAEAFGPFENRAVANGFVENLREKRPEAPEIAEVVRLTRVDVHEIEVFETFYEIEGEDDGE